MNQRVTGWGGQQYKLGNRSAVSAPAIADTAAADNDTLLRDASGGAFNQSLPPADESHGRDITVVNIGGANDVTVIISVASGDAINGTVVVTPGTSVTYRAITPIPPADGGGIWQVVGEG